jgi:hypothetical protein
MSATCLVAVAAVARYEGFVAPLPGAVTWEIRAGTTAPIMLA